MRASASSLPASPSALPAVQVIRFSFSFLFISFPTEKSSCRFSGDAMNLIHYGLSTPPPLSEDDLHIARHAMDSSQTTDPLGYYSL